MKRRFFLSILTLLLAFASGGLRVFADDAIFGWRMSGTDAPENGGTIGGCTDWLGSITFNSASDATWQVENALYSSEVDDNYHASNGKALKAGSNYLYIKIELTNGGKFKTGDRVNVCGYNSWIISSGAEDSKRGDISAALETGTDKDNYKVGSVRIPVGIETSTIYLSRANSSSTGVASIDITRVTGNVVGPDAKNISWTGQTADAYSAAYELTKNTEYTFNFDVDNDGKTDPWFSWVIMASESESNLNPGAGYFSLRPDNYVYEGWSGNSINTLALVGGALDWETFKRDINGAHVTAKVSFDGTNMFVYQIIENNGRTYTYYYPYTLSSAKDKVYLRVGVDQSQLTHFEASAVGALKLYTYVRNMSGVEKPEMGSIVMTNQQGVTILEGSTVGKGTIVRLTETANSGYVFDHWSNGSKEYYREFEVGSNGDTEAHNFSAYFKSLADFETNWTLATTADPLYYSDGKQWDKNSNATFNSGGDNMTNEYDGAYVDASGTEMATTAGLLFNSHVRLAKKNGAEIMLYENGSVRIPVKAGEVVSVTGYTNTASRKWTILNSDGQTTKTVDVPTASTTFSVVAVADGYITVTNNNGGDRYPHITNISKTAVRDFTFADGTSVPAQPGCVGYINAPKGTTELQQQIVDLSTFTWTSSNPADVSVDPSTGAIIINNSFNGSVQITATMNAVKDASGSVTLPAVAKSYTLTTSTNKMKFANEAVDVMLDENSIATYWQSVTWTDPNNIPEGDIHYTVVSTTAKKAEVTSDDNGDGSWNVTIFGKGVTVIKATCGALSATYKITSAGFVFDNNGVDVYDFAGYYQQAISGATYTIAHKYGAIASTNIGVNSDGSLTNLPSYDDNKGGAIVVEATANVNGETKKASYVLTIPYKKYVWNFYKQGLTGDNYNQVLATTTDGAEGNKYHFVFGDLLQNVRCPGSAPEQPATGTIPNDGSGEFPGQYAIDAIINAASNDGQKTNLQKMLQWRTDQDLESVKNDANDPHNYFNYTYKTLEHQYKNSKKPISYSNEALFSYKDAVNGNNARIISDTQGLVFSCGANKFGINDNHTGTVQDNTEQDRAVLLRGYSSFTVPHVTEGHYIKIHWYRHAPNSGDQFYVTNAKDLDGKTINPSDKLRFTSAHYTHHNWEGSLILQAASTGDVTITIANANWTELYRIEVTDTYESDQKLCETIVTKPEGGTPYSYTSGAFERDINDQGVFNRERLSAGSSDYGPVRINKLVSRVQTHAKGGALIQSPEDLYFTGYAAQCYTWNGWMNNRVTAEFEGTARCDVAHDDENNIDNILPVEFIRIGNSLDYPMHPLKNVKGVGTIKLTMRTITGFDGEPHYTLNKQVAYVPVGEYSVQEYPYTWDFTKYNTSKKNAYSSGSDYKTMDKFNSNQNAQNHYGSYATDMKMAANAAQDVNGGYAYIEGHKAPVSAQRNKRFFAQGAQLALGDGDCHTILEAEGLRINLNAVNDANNGAVYFTKNGDETTLVVNGTITVPEVDKGMYVFVRSAAKPTSVTGATEVTTDAIKQEIVTYQGFDNNKEVTLKQADIPSNVWVYLQETDGLNDVVITPAGAVEGIGVTKYFKKMVQFENTDRASYTTDSRHERIDYQNTGFFTKHDLKAYIAKSAPTMVEDDEVPMNRENGTLAIQEVTKAVPSSTADTQSKRGLILEDNVTDNACTTRPLLPLFVPACNIEDEDISKNTLVDRIGYDKNGNVDQSSSYVAASTKEGTYNYGLTNMYYDWNWAEGVKKSEAGKYDGFVDAISFVMIRENGYFRPNSAYFTYTPNAATNSVKNVYMYVGEADEDNATAIENVIAADGVDIAEPTEVYTLTGVKLQGIPAKKGVYVVNGKKVFIK